MSVYRVTYTVLVELDEENATVKDAVSEVAAALWEVGQGIGETSRLLSADLDAAEEVTR